MLSVGPVWCSCITDDLVCTNTGPGRAVHVMDMCFLVLVHGDSLKCAVPSLWLFHRCTGLPASIMVMLAGSLPRISSLPCYVEVWPSCSRFGNMLFKGV